MLEEVAVVRHRSSTIGREPGVAIDQPDMQRLQLLMGPARDVLHQQVVQIEVPL